MALIAAQMYTLREFCTTPKNVAIAYSKIKKMGYDGVQISGICKMPPEEMRRILDGEGLKCAATHCGMDAFDDMERLKVEHEILGCNYVALGGFFPCKADSTLENWRAFIAKFNEANRKLAGSSLMLGYHNHCHELMQLRPGKERPLDLLFRGLDPTVWFEIDTFWYYDQTGLSAAGILERLKDRISFSDQIHSYRDLKTRSQVTTLVMSLMST